jgi:hypothetical protein
VPIAVLSCSAALSSVTEARHFLTATLAAWGVEGYDMGARIVVTELAANAALHARSDYTVRIRHEGTRLVVEVADQSPKLPRFRPVSAEATTGRGLRLVEVLSHAWGAAPDPTGAGKVVWAHVLPDDAQVAPPFDVTDIPVGAAAPTPQRLTPPTTGRSTRAPTDMSVIDG